MNKRDCITAPSDFARALKEGRRVSGQLLFMNVRSRALQGPVRFGLVVSKKQGGAVKRNLMRRRLRSILAAVQFPPGSDVILGARGPAKESSFQELEHEVHKLTKELTLNAKVD
jgi:ribonuclease P protein component